MDIAKKELWDRLNNESERAYRAFQTFLNLPSGDRSVVDAYREHVGNPEAPKPSDTWVRWSREYAWAERAAAYDDHLASKRRDAYERGVEEEAERQGAMAERTRNRLNEMLTLGYEQGIEWLESAQPSDLRPQDVISIAKLHLDAIKALNVPEAPSEQGWTEEDDRDLAERILPEVEGKAEADEIDEDGENFGDNEDY